MFPKTLRVALRKTLRLIERAGQRVRRVEENSFRSYAVQAERELLGVGAQIGLDLADDAKLRIESGAKDRDNAGCRNDRGRWRVNGPVVFIRERKFGSRIQIDVGLPGLRYSSRVPRVGGK